MGPFTAIYTIDK